MRSSASPIGHGSGNVADLGCSAEYLAAVELLADVQDQAGVPFPLPNEFTREEVLELERAKRLLAGEEIRGTWTQSSGQLKRKHAQLLTNDLAQIGDAFILFNRRPMWLEIGIWRIPLGWVLHIAHSARLSNRTELEEWLAAAEAHDDEIKVEFSCANTQDVTVRLDPDSPINAKP